MAITHYDLIVIGAGAAGLTAVETAHARGLKVAFVEKHKIGGECTHWGCVPSKSLLHIAKMWHNARQMGRHGLPQLPWERPGDFAAIMGHVRDTIARAYGGSTAADYAARGIQAYLCAEGARFMDDHSVRVNDEMLHADHFVIATGSSPAHPPIPGLAQADPLDNRNIWDLNQRPNRLAFIGGGPIACELGQAMQRLGSQVILLEQEGRILGPFEPETAAVMARHLADEGMDIRTGVEVKEVRKRGEGYEILWDAGAVRCDAVFVAAGRKANVEALDLGQAGVVADESGIVTNEFMQTSVPHIFAVGDVTSRHKFTHAASFQAKVAVKNICSDRLDSHRGSVVPFGLFTEPEMGHVGWTEEEARAEYGDKVRVILQKGTADRYGTDCAGESLFKLVVGPGDRILGACGVGPRAGEWMQILTLAIQGAVPFPTLRQTIFVYPTYAEIVNSAFARYEKEWM